MLKTHRIGIARDVQPALIALCIGLVVGLLISLSAPAGRRGIPIVFGALVGIGIYGVSHLLNLLFSERIKRLSGRGKTAALAGLFLVSSVVAWVLANTLTGLLFDLRLQSFTRPMIILVFLNALIAVTVGLAFHSFHRMQDRLAESVARLKESEFAERELQLARGLQSRLLPPAETEGEGYRVAARNLAARVVAGDFYDVFPLSDGALGLVVADVAGKGMAAALIMASVKAMLPLIAAERSAEETLSELNRKLARELSPREFVALAFARYDPRGGTLTLANAGLPDPYLLREGEAPRPLEVPGPRLPLGVRREVDYRALEVHLEPGERLLLFTDGLAEAPVAEGEPLGYTALASMLAAVPPAAAPLPQWLDGLLERLRSATLPALEDDWTALVLERRVSTPRNK